MAGDALTLPVTGMRCAGCAASVERALTGVEGVAAAEVNVALEQATLRLDAPAPAARLVEAVRRAGFGVRLEETVLETGAGFDAAGLRAHPAIVSVTTGDGAARIAALPGLSSAEILAVAPGARIAAAPDPDALARQERAAARAETRRLGVAIALTLPLLVAMLGRHLGAPGLPPGWLQAALAAPVLLWCGQAFWRGALAALRTARANMDSLVTLGAGTAFLASLAALATGGPLHFDAAALIVTLVLLGKWLESRARRAAAAALTALDRLRPDTATVLRGGAETEVPVAALTIGDIVILRPGARAPADGVILKGESAFDESLVTGESLPVSRGPGDAVPAGALNGDGLVRMRAERVGGDDALARIGRMVAQAQTGKAPVQRLVDRVAAVFTPAVLTIAALTLAGWLLAGAGLDAALSASIAVLVIACPCALGLATPAALVAGSGAAARAGILIRDIEALERAAGIDLVAFDKTGTLSEGEPAMTGFETIGIAENTALRLAAAAQAGSEHLLARAMRDAALSRGLQLPEPETAQAEPGGGLRAVVEGRRIAIGKPGFGGENGPFAARLVDEPRTLALVWIDDAPAALALFEDRLREDAKEAIAALARQGRRTLLLSGDAAGAVARAAQALGMAEFRARLSPEEKIAALRAARAEGRSVAMVGDGVNDAPALAAADLGVAMGSGTDVARAAAGVVLMRPRPALVPAALDIAAATRRTIRQNLLWAFLYNTLLIPVAAFGLLEPALAAGAMALSSLSVVLNALRLTRWTPALR